MNKIKSMFVSDNTVQGKFAPHVSNLIARALSCHRKHNRLLLPNILRFQSVLLLTQPQRKIKSLLKLEACLAVQTKAEWR